MISKVDVVLADLRYALWRNRNKECQKYDLLTPEDVRNEAKMLQDEIKPKVHAHASYSTSQLAILYMVLLWKREKIDSGRQKGFEKLRSESKEDDSVELSTVFVIKSLELYYCGTFESYQQKQLRSVPCITL